jgi:hypothetical protein
VRLAYALVDARRMSVAEGSGPEATMEAIKELTQEVLRQEAAAG